MMMPARVLLAAAARLAVVAAQHHYGPAPTDRCDAAMAAACGKVQGGAATCHTCAGTHAAPIQAAGCAPSDISGFCTRGMDPRYKKNVTVYHINPSTFGDVPVNENTGDLHGDMYFYLRSTMTPMECRVPSPSTAKDCANAEVVATDLVVRELVLEVDGRFTNYALCNVCVNGSDHHGNNHCKDGSYTCTCRDCNASIGARPCNRYGSGACRSDEADWSCWRQKTAEKTVDGIWYSTLGTGLCSASVPFCTWRVAEIVKRVSHACLNDRINTAVEAANEPCFATCGQTRNISSDCWITCFYDAVLGPAVATGGPIGGMPLATLDAAWTNAFRSDDPHAGGCPAVRRLPPPPQQQQERAPLKTHDAPGYTPLLHICGSALYDPSAPIQRSDGTWHLFEDVGGWSHYHSRDLLHWTKSNSTTHFSGMTGSIAVTDNGTFAIWPDRAQTMFNRSEALDVGLTSWGPKTTVLGLPPGVAKMQDPARALKLADGRWYLLGACDVSAEFTGLCLFRASDSTLSEFTPASGTDGLFFKVNQTLGAIDANGVWTDKVSYKNPIRTSHCVSLWAVRVITLLWTDKNWPLGHLDAGCPDLFPFGEDGQYGMLLTYGGPPRGTSTNPAHMQEQWWTGEIDMQTFQFRPTATGLVDYGNMFAAKSGTTEHQSGTSRRVLFAFPGWTQATKPKAAPKCLNLPRDLTPCADGRMRISPIPEMASLRRRAGSRSELAGGTQVEVRLSCASAPSGAVGVDMLATADGAQRTRVGYDYTRQMLVVDQRASCGPAHSGGIVQTAPAALAHGESVELVVYVDGYILEVFMNNRTALTALVPGCAFTPPPSPPGPLVTCVEVAENMKAPVGCPAGEVISSVDFASFGTPGGSCAAGFTHAAECDSNHSVAVVAAACVGKNKCILDASCATFHETLIGPGAFCWVRTLFCLIHRLY
jgi:sucrose-6-phosphate hydrolase SacC (GH32 family)